jgi:4-amino-4-deoxy-L-arabinose transferase-like glycosyltransferase
MVSEAIFHEQGLKMTFRDMLAISTLLLFAVIVRQLFFIGPSGSDDAVYLDAALKIAGGNWTVDSNYNGSLRFGFHAPMALFISLFGTSLNAANAFSLICSLLEILLVYTLAFDLLGRKVAYLAAILFAFTPLQMLVSTSIHADPVAAMAITASVVTFYFAEQRRRPILYVMTGLAIGYVFWVKELIIFYVLIFPIYMAVVRKWDSIWLYVIAGGIIMLLAHLLYMFVNAGDPFYLFNIMKTQIARDFVGAGKKESSPIFYVNYLFFGVYWTLLLGWLTFFGAILYVYRRLSGAPASPVWYVFWWFFSLLLLFTFLPISLSPFQFVTKQSNYINLFLAPMAILSAWFISQVHRYITYALAAGSVVAGTLMLMIYQATIRVHVSGSEQVHLFALQNPDIDVYVANNTIAMSLYRQREQLHEKLQNLIDIRKLPLHGLDQHKRHLVAVDPMTIMDVPSRFEIKQRPACWREVQQLVPLASGTGMKITTMLLPYIPSLLRRPLESRVQMVPVTLSEIDPLRPWCTQ